MKIKEALELIPTHICLTEKHKWQEGDEIYIGKSWSLCRFKTDQFTYKGEKEFCRLFHGQHGWTDLIKNENVNYEAARRPIPESVRQAMAELMISAPNSKYEPLEFWLLTTQGK